MLNISKPTIIRTFVISTIVSFCVLAFVMLFSKKNDTYNRFPEIYNEVRKSVKNTKPTPEPMPKPKKSVTIDETIQNPVVVEEAVEGYQFP